MKSAEESAYLTAHTVRNKVVTIHSSQVLKMLSLYMQIHFEIVSLKNTDPTIILALTAHKTPTITG
jgi:hypothetical protein